MKHLFIFSLALCLIAGCTKDEIDFYGDTDYIYFANDSADVVEYSFAFNPGAQRDTVSLVMKLVGKISADDRPVVLTVDAAHTTALGTDFELPDRIVLRGGFATDTIPLVLHNSARLQQEKYTIRLRIEGNEYFKLGPVPNRHIDIMLSDMIARPAWWNSIVTTNFLGEYSDSKYRFFIEATSIADMSELSENEQRAYAIIFRDFLARGREQGEVYEDENGLIQVSPNLT